MNRIDAKFAELKQARRVALMPYLPLGYPTIDLSVELICAIANAGADILELGVPFSDPLADGPVIQRATQVALQNGMTLGNCLRMVSQARRAGITIPLVLMGYYNPILRFGVEAFTSAAKDAGVDGFIVPDLPPEESDALSAACQTSEIDLIFLAAPTSTPERLQAITRATRGFTYLVSVAGVTGARSRLPAGLPEFVARIRATTEKPVCVGFGIANAESAKRIAGFADGVIVGSALVERIGDKQNAIENASRFVAELRRAIRI